MKRTAKEAADGQDILPAVEIVRIHSNPKRKRGNDLATSLTLRVTVSLNRGQYTRGRGQLWGMPPPLVEMTALARLRSMPVRSVDQATLLAVFVPERSGTKGPEKRCRLEAMPLP